MWMTKRTVPFLVLLHCSSALASCVTYEDVVSNPMNYTCSYAIAQLAAANSTVCTICQRRCDTADCVTIQSTPVCPIAKPVPHASCPDAVVCHYEPMCLPAGSGTCTFLSIATCREDAWQLSSAHLLRPPPSNSPSPPSYVAPYAPKWLPPVILVALLLVLCMCVDLFRTRDDLHV